MILLSRPPIHPELCGLPITVDGIELIQVIPLTLAESAMLTDSVSSTGPSGLLTMGDLFGPQLA
jgi:hypothetical protein